MAPDHSEANPAPSHWPGGYRAALAVERLSTLLPTSYVYNVLRRSESHNVTHNKSPNFEVVAEMKDEFSSSPPKDSDERRGDMIGNGF